MCAQKNPTRTWVGECLPRPGKTPRLHSILTIEDAVVLRAVKSALDPVWPKIPKSIIGGRPGTVPQVAVTEFFSLISENDGWLLRFDIAQAFASASLQRALQSLEDYSERREALALVRAWAVRQGGRFPGLIEGQPLGPLMLAALLAPMMRELEQIGLVLLYLDDGLLVVDNEEELRVALDIIGQHFKGLGLELHPDKTVICQLDSKNKTPTPWQFLGFQMRNGQPIPGRSKCDVLVCRLAQMAQENVDADDIAADIVGWAAYYATENSQDILRDTDRKISAWVGYLGPLPRLEKLVGTRTSLRPRGLEAGGIASRAYRKSRYGGSDESIVDSGTGKNQSTGFHVPLWEFLSTMPGDVPGDVAVAGTVEGDSALCGVVPPIGGSGGRND